MMRNIIIIITLSFACSPLYARWATADDSYMQIVQANIDYIIHADGTAETVRDLKYKILNENGRASYSAMPLYYNKSSSKLEVLLAQTVVDGQQYKLDADLIEDKPLASEISGFDQTNQILLAFPNVKVGAILELKDRRTIIKPEMPGLFESFISCAHDNILTGVTNFKSEIPLYITYNDPDNYLNIKQSKQADFYTISVKLRKPIYIEIADEHANLLAPHRYPWIYVTTINNWQDFGAKTAMPFIKVLQQPLPQLYQQIADAAKKDTDPIKQINNVMSLLNEAVQYMGDWKTSDGRHTPRDLAQVALKRLGDCKDFATGTAAILNSIGIKANVALVERGEGIYDSSFLKLPGQSNFNHAMVKVTLDSKVLWVDPTNFVIIADRILPDIADRQVLVLDSKDTKLERIPASQLNDAKLISQRTIDLRNTYVAQIKGNTLMQGLAAVQLTGAELRSSKDSIEYFVLYNQGSFQNMVDKKVQVPELKSRIVSDLKFDFEFKENNKVISTNAGQAVLFSNSIANSYIYNDTQVSDVYLGSPIILRDVTILENITAIDKMPLDCIVSSPWVDAMRTVKYGKNSVTVEQEFKIKKSWISNEMLKSPDYKKLSRDLAKFFKEGVAIVFKNK